MVGDCHLFCYRYRPDLFDYEELLAVDDAEYALAHAFQIANANLNIPKLLDPEGEILRHFWTSQCSPCWVGGKGLYDNLNSGRIRNSLVV